MFEEINAHRQAVANNINKAFDEDIEKARSGVYTDNSKNRKLNRVGQQYGKKKTVKTAIDILIEEDAEAGEQISLAGKESLKWLESQRNTGDKIYDAAVEERIAQIKKEK